MQKIVVSTNNTIKYLNSLKEKRNILKEKKFLIEGKNIINEALSNKIVLKLIISDESFYKDINIEKILVTNEIIKKLSFTSTNRGAIALCKYEPKNVEIENLNRIIVLDSVNDPGNLGTIIRTAKGFNFDAVVLLNDSTFPYNDKSIRASQGMIFSFPVLNIRKLDEFSKFKIYFFVSQKSKTDLNKVEKNNEKIALFFGNESNGINENTLKNLNGETINININKNVESLNLAISAGVAMFYFDNLN